MQSQQSNKCIMVMVEIDSNANLVELMKSRKDAEMIHTYNTFSLQNESSRTVLSNTLTSKHNHVEIILEAM
jgi:hypothetical protein